ncbi:MAG: hypothetical protein E7553_02415 [Ruminococcaceae bacterium]|nr:hypothetical protein [Oscillospiraceae bacterium]
METRVAVISAVVEDREAVETLNAVLHEYGDWIIGRMGLPYRKKNIHIVSVAVDAPQDVIATMSGKLGRIEKVSVKTAYSSVITHE